MTFSTIIRKLSAFLPVLMSLAALALVLVHLALFGVTQQEDESAYARLFQLLLVTELPIVAYFAFRWLPRYPRAALEVLILQVFAALAALAPIVILEP